MHTQFIAYTIIHSLTIITYDVGEKWVRAVQREGANLLIVWYLAIKFDSPDCRKKQPLISSGLRKLQASEVAAFKPSVVYRQEGSNDDWKGGFQQVGQRIAPESGHPSDGEPRGWRDLRAGMTKRPRDRTRPRERKRERGKGGRWDRFEWLRRGWERISHPGHRSCRRR